MNFIRYIKKELNFLRKRGFSFKQYANQIDVTEFYYSKGNLVIEVLYEILSTKSYEAVFPNDMDVDEYSKILFANLYNDIEFTIGINRKRRNLCDNNLKFLNDSALSELYKKFNENRYDILKKIKLLRNFLVENLEKPWLKKLFFQNLFSKNKKYNFIYEDYEDLKEGVLNLEKLLNCSPLIIKINSFSYINGIIKDKKVMSIKNYNYYLVEDLDFLKEVPFGLIQDMNIYFSDRKVTENNILSVIKNQLDFHVYFNNIDAKAFIKINNKKYSEILNKLL